MVTEKQKLFCIRRMTFEKLCEHKLYASNEFLPLRTRKYFKKQIIIERCILQDISKRLVILDAEV